MTPNTRTDDGSPASASAPQSGIGAASASAPLSAQLDTLRIAAGETEVLAAVTVEWFDNGDWGDADPERLERLAYLLGLIAKSSATVVGAVNRFHGAFADAQPADGGDKWDRDDTG